ncbi:MAG: aminotransferase class I/II-fold pyridoxal phosphate-dependent enzyme, partial [Bacteroidota bacterium]
MLPKKLQKKLEQRQQQNAFRNLSAPNMLVDFVSNDYLGFSKSKTISERTAELLSEFKLQLNGSGGSRLLSGNHALYSALEQQLKLTHDAEAALVYNSGYTANLGLISCLAQRGDIILFDELCHASIRDAISASYAKTYKFGHNNLFELNKLLEKHSAERDYEIYIITESVFSMDGDSPDLIKMIPLAHQFNAGLIIDEAHAVGVFENGLVQNLELQHQVFARIVTFGKALGNHGAAILGPSMLIDFLINFSRPFIYTTALPPHTIATAIAAYEQLASHDAQSQLGSVIAHFKKMLDQFQLKDIFISSNSAIQSALIPGNNIVFTLLF